MTQVELDLSGLKCPLPVLKTRKKMLGLKAADVLRVIADDPMAQIDIPHLVHTSGSTLMDAHEHKGVWSFTILIG